MVSTQNSWWDAEDTKLRRPEEDVLNARQVSTVASSRGRWGATPSFKTRCASWHAHSGSSGMNWGRKREETHERRRGQRRKSTGECQTCWRNFPQERASASDPNALQQPLRFPLHLLLQGRQPWHHPCGSSNRSLFLMAHTAMQTYSGLSHL